MMPMWWASIWSLSLIYFCFYSLVYDLLLHVASMCSDDIKAWWKRLAAASYCAPPGCTLNWGSQGDNILVHGLYVASAVGMLRMHGPLRTVHTRFSGTVSLHFSTYPISSACLFILITEQEMFHCAVNAQPRVDVQV